MKKKIGLFLGLVAVSVSLIACSETSVEADIPSSFEILTIDEVRFTEVYVIKEKNTGCFYVSSIASSNSAGGNSITQMMIEKNGVSVPYCE